MEVNNISVLLRQRVPKIINYHKPFSLQHIETKKRERSRFVLFMCSEDSFVTTRKCKWVEVKEDSQNGRIMHGRQ